MSIENGEPTPRPASLTKFWFYVAVAVAIPGVVLRLAGHTVSNPLLSVLLFGTAILSAGFLLSWGAEAAEDHVSQGLALAALAVVTMLPEYAVDIYYTFQAGHAPHSDYVQFAAANMTGANRLLIGVAWPLIALLSWWRTGGREKHVTLREGNAVEIAYLTLASLYGFVIVLKGRIDLLDAAVLGGIFAAYLWRLGRLPRSEPADADDDAEVGPAAALSGLPKRYQWAVIAGLTAAAAFVILAVAEPFAEALVRTGGAFGMNTFSLVQWVAPLAGEAPEIIICVLFVLARRPGAALGALVSDKINQWTLLVGTLPIVFSLGAHHVLALPLDVRQHEEFFLTAAQSVFAVSLLLRLRLDAAGALTLLILFAAQLALAFLFRHDEARAISVLTGIGWLYLALAAWLLVAHRQNLTHLIRFGLIGVGHLPTDNA